jgi:hypothetical protein
MNEAAEQVEKDIKYAHRQWLAMRGGWSRARLVVSGKINDLLVDLARERGDTTPRKYLSVFHGMRVVIDMRSVGFLIEEEKERD